MIKNNIKYIVGRWIRYPYDKIAIKCIEKYIKGEGYMVYNK